MRASAAFLIPDPLFWPAAFFKPPALLAGQARAGALIPAAGRRGDGEGVGTESPGVRLGGEPDEIPVPAGHHLHRRRPQFRPGEGPDPGRAGFPASDERAQQVIASLRESLATSLPGAARKAGSQRPASRRADVEPVPVQPLGPGPVALEGGHLHASLDQALGQAQPAEATADDEYPHLSPNLHGPLNGGKAVHALSHVVQACRREIGHPADSADLCRIRLLEHDSSGKSNTTSRI